MADSPVFEWVSSEIERRTTLSRIEARGTVRLVLKQAGLEPAAVTVEQMAVVLNRLLGKALSVRRVDDADAICADLMESLRLSVGRPDSSTVESAYDVFRRLGRDPGSNGRNL